MRMDKSAIMWSILTVAVMLGISGCIPAGTGNPTRVPFGWVPTPIVPRQIADNRLNLREHWRVSQNGIGGGISDPLLLAVAERVIYFKWHAEESTGRLQVRDATSGNLVWESPDKYGLWARYLAADGERTYVHAGNEIQAYDLENGKRLWISQVQWHKSYNLYVEKDVLCVHDIEASEIRYLNARTGEELNRLSLVTDDGFPLLARFPQFDLYRTPSTLQAVDAMTQQLLWETRVSAIWHTYERPGLFGNVLLVGMYEPVSAIDVQTGQIKWHNIGKPFASNFVVMNGSLYALNYSAQLVQLDIETGQEMGHLQFTPDQADYSISRYWVATNGQMLFVSFDDSQELIALGP